MPGENEGRSNQELQEARQKEAELVASFQHHPAGRRHYVLSDEAAAGPAGPADAATDGGDE